MTNQIKKGSAKAWFLAARPKTLSAALVPVVAASALAASDGKFGLVQALLCVVFAAIMQIAANFINDLYDFLKGTDGSDRLGPERACAQGWISPRQMRVGIAVSLVLACSAGACLLLYGGWWLIWLGLACVVFAFLYTTMLSYCGLGDLLVWAFFGFVPVIGCYYVQAGEVSAGAIAVAASIGMAVDNLLVLNNYRDRDTDHHSGKRTIVVVFGEKFGRLFYLWQGLAAYAACSVFFTIEGKLYVPAFLLVYIIVHYITWCKMSAIRQGKALNRILGETSRNILIFGLALSAALLL